jgi:hypothetical protein
VDQILAEITSKRTNAIAEKEKWSAKKRSYEDEVQKWRGIANEARSNAKNLKRMKN